MIKIVVGIDPDLSRKELTELLQMIRDIEQNDPDRKFNIFLDLPDWSKEETVEVLNSIEPPLPIWVVK